MILETSCNVSAFRHVSNIVTDTSIRCEENIFPYYKSLLYGSEVYTSNELINKMDFIFLS